jgi:hypothetical protein
MKELALHEKTWLACAIDAEGTISLYVQSNDRTITPYIGIYNTHPDFCQRAWQLTLLGHVRVANRPTGNKPVFVWEIRKQSEVLELIETVEPYLIIKREQARIVKRYIELRKTHRSENGGFTKKERYHSDEERILVNQIRKLGSKGGFTNHTLGVKT